MSPSLGRKFKAKVPDPSSDATNHPSSNKEPVYQYTPPPSDMTNQSYTNNDMRKGSYEYADN